MISPNKAIDYLLDLIGKRDIRNDAIKLAVASLKKQNPVKIIIKWDKHYCKNESCCGVCGGYVLNYEKYCPFCGQKIDWSKDE